MYIGCNIAQNKNISIFIFLLNNFAPRKITKASDKNFKIKNNNHELENINEKSINIFSISETNKNKKNNGSHGLCSNIRMRVNLDISIF